MSHSSLLLVLLTVMALAYHLGRRRALTVVGGGAGIRQLHSRPVYYGFYVAIWCGLPSVLLLGIWILWEPTLITHWVVQGLPEDMRAMPDAQLGLIINDIKNLALGNIVSGDVRPHLREAADHYLRLQQWVQSALAVVMMSIALAGAAVAWRFINPQLRARNQVERVLMAIMIACSTLAVFTTIGIVLSVLFESLRFFQRIPFTEFLFGLEWSPQTSIRSDQVGSSGSFGAIPLFAGTLLITLIAMLVAVPIGLMGAIYLAEYARPRIRAWVKPLLEILAGIPTVVYGFFAALTVAPWMRDFGTHLGLHLSSESALAAGLVMGIMIIPFVSSIADDVINAVPQSLRDASYALGATRSETVRRVVFLAALPGIVGGVLLAVSRAIGETMIVVMAAGLSAHLTANPFAAVTTVTVQIVTLLTGDQEFDSAKTLAAFALGLVLFVVTLLLNVVALYIVRRYREQYE